MITQTITLLNKIAERCFHFAKAPLCLHLGVVYRSMSCRDEALGVEREAYLHNKETVPSLLRMKSLANTHTSLTQSHLVIKLLRLAQHYRNLTAPVPAASAPVIATTYILANPLEKLIKLPHIRLTLYVGAPPRL
ncbi:hypothetical protein J6590_001162 [Homalodisca vitripennis]|nr:hypothetical protein J6590_001162 [Homalodisca vitripennis]